MAVQLLVLELQNIKGRWLLVVGKIFPNQIVWSYKMLMECGC